ncbi:MAG TPA: hypothetical protein VNN18_03785 [Candidatus Xenobia bacterium]|nr:hypothetical protein [Candidatus Xenobia bacterium]
MKRKLPRILVVGSRAPFNDLFNALEAAGAHQLLYAAYWGTAKVFLEPPPDAILLHLPEEKRAADQALAWLEKLTGDIPVIVMSPAANMEGYLACMTRGAFDYITAYTPLPDVQRILESAIRLKKPVAA